MAKLSAHGAELGRLEFTDYRKAYMADGAILKDTGHGWKIHGKVKPNFDPRAVFEKAKARQAELLATRPHFRAYKEAVTSVGPLSRRWRLTLAMRMMPTDPDGVWSEVCDGFDPLHLSFDEVQELFRLRQAAEDEARALEPATDPT